jgi:hypothetical protein
MTIFNYFRNSIFLLSKYFIFNLKSKYISLNKNSRSAQIFMMNSSKINLNKNSRSAQIFMMDLVFSFVILLVAIGIASIYYTQVSDDEGLYDFTQQSINRLTSLSINSLNNEEIRTLFSQGKITDIEYSLAQQISTFYYLGDQDLAKNITRIFYENTEGKEFFMNITLGNQTNNFELYSSPQIRVSYEDSRVSYSLNREVITFYNGTTIIGPYTFTITIWQ